MDRSLVVIEATDNGRRLLTLADEIAAGTGTELLLVRAIDQGNYDRDLERKAQSSQGDLDSIDEIEKQARETASNLGEEILSEETTYDVCGLVGTLPDDLLKIANSQNCDHIFITGKKRSPTGKVLFGDTAQSVLLNFEGAVTSIIK